MKKILITLVLSLVLLIPVVTMAAPGGFGFGTTLDGVARDSGYSPGNELSLDQRISSFIGIFLSFLGVIFMILMLYGGYNWMTAAGDEKKVDKAKDTIRAAVIGLVIVIASYAISVFIVSRIWGASSSQTLLTPLMPTIAYAQSSPTITPQTAPMLDRLKGVGADSGFADATESSILDIVGVLINSSLGLLGVIFEILMLLAGYNWMTANGDEEKITKAKSTLKTSIIGLIIIVGAFAIWNFLATFLISDGANSGGGL